MKTQPENLYRNQFVLGPRFLDAFPAWQRPRIKESLCLTVHPDLNICRQTQGEKSITLLGYILDPDSPEATDAQILSRLLEKFESFPGLLEDTYRLGGRWILIVAAGNSVKLFHDAWGLRQVFYARGTNTDSGTWCASQPGMLGELLELQVNREADEFFRLQIFRGRAECEWPLDTSPFLDVHRLLPNHYLDLETAKPCRYWPDKEINLLSMQEVVDSAGQTLCGLMEAACNRFDLSLGVTSGIDSRLVLAASRGIAHRISFHTLQHLDTPYDNSVDISIAKSLLKKLGLKHNLIQTSTSIDEELFECYSKSITYPHVWWYPGVQASREYSGLKKVGAAGSGSELARCIYPSLSNQNHKSISSSELAAIEGMSWHPFPVRHIQHWLDDWEDTRGFKIVDLFHWEQVLGSWQAMCHGEWDTAWKDIFTPFNCRALLTQMLGVKEEYRRYPYLLHKRLISNLWPELLQEPINPHKEVIENPVRQCKRWIRYKLGAARRTIKSRLVG
jgi:hypothetical protein